MAEIAPARLVRLSKSCLGEAEKRAVREVLDREYLGMGAEVQQFEQGLGDFFGRPAVCVVNGTAALHLALQAAGIGRGDEVLVQSLTYVASFQAISATGATPIACDVNGRTLTLDVADAEQRITSRTKAVMPVHYGGGIGALDEIHALARRHGLRVIEDAAHAFGATHDGRRVGGFGDIACFSFDGIKNITSGEGGCIVTEDQDILRRVRDARLLGVERDTERRYARERSWEFDVTAQGWRYHMSEIMAAIGRVQLARSADLFQRRRELAALYVALLSPTPRVRPVLADFSAVVPHIFPVRIAGLADREALRRRLRERGLETGVHYFPNHRLSLYAPHAGRPLPVTESVYPELLTLPLHPDLREDDVMRVCSALAAELS